jgi:hypothetical protein
MIVYSTLIWKYEATPMIHKRLLIPMMNRTNTGICFVKMNPQLHQLKLSAPLSIVLLRRLQETPHNTITQKSRDTQNQ